MKLNKSRNKSIFLSLSLFTIIILGIFSTTVSASPSYQSTLVKGTEIYIVNQYDDAAWKATVNLSSTPTNWFEGNTNNSGAKSKITLKGWNYITWETWDVFTTIFMSEYFSFDDIIILLGIMNSIGYNETTININYTNSYNLWYGLRAVWNFTTSDFGELSSYNDGILVFEDPLDFKLILDDYNLLAADLNGELAIQIAGYSLPILDADDFLWQLVLNGLSIAKPQTNYLLNLISELGSVNASSDGTTLTFNRHGETNYTVEISYGEKGTFASFTVKDVNGDIIFQILSTSSEWIFYLVLIILAACGTGLVIYIIMKKRKPKR
ncbi:MAG: hypothetical protein ACXAEX_18920 [Promethearchaeota archaeon]|jgi:hypothetical protein